MDKQCSDLHIAKIATFLPQWKNVAKLFGLSYQQISDIEKQNFTNAKEQRTEALRVWVAQKGSDATYRKLYDVLRELEEAEAAEKVKELSSEQSSAPPFEEPDGVRNDVPTPAEQPAYGDEETARLEGVEEKMVTAVRPEDKFVVSYSKQVQIILQVVNKYELLALIGSMSPPEGRSTMLRFGSKIKGKAEEVQCILGMLCRYKVALVHTNPGAGCETQIITALVQFPNASYIIGVGVAYGNNPKDIMLGDVLVSERIKGFDVTKFNNEDKIVGRGETRKVHPSLSAWFAKNSHRFHNKFACTKGASPRYAQVHPGLILSASFLIDNKEIKMKLVWPDGDEAKGGEMEGFALMNIVGNEVARKLGAIIIKGVCDYGDGEKKKNWQLTAALAAVKYTSKILETTNGTLFEHEDVSEDVLARTIWGEARGGGKAGMEAVASVIVNRVYWPHEGHQVMWWGSTVEEVCKKPSQFWSWIPSNPNLQKMLAVTAEDEQFRMALEISKEAVARNLHDQTNGATHYHALKMKPEPDWTRGHTPTATIGGYIFYKIGPD